MKNVILKVFGLFMTIFAVSQFAHVEKAHATMPETHAKKNSTITTDKHGSGCACTCCMPPAETKTQDVPT